MLAAGEQIHWDGLKLSAVSALYSDNDDIDVPIELVPATPISQLDVIDGYATQLSESGFIASVAELKTAGIWPPVKGAKITYTDEGGTARAFEVMPGAGEEFYRVYGNYGIMVKINVKEISSA